MEVIPERKCKGSLDTSQIESILVWGNVKQERREVQAMTRWQKGRDFCINEPQGKSTE